jgi:hypothetical protein
MSFPPSNYISNQNSVRRWDNILNNLRKEIAFLRKLTIKGARGPLKANRTGLVGGSGSTTTTTTVVNDIFSTGGFLTLSRIFLNFNININKTITEEILPISSWGFDYGNIGDVLTDGHYYVAQSSINGQSTANTKMFIQVMFKSNYEFVYDFDSANLEFQLIKNGTTLVAVSKYSEQFLNDTVVFRSLTAEINDIIICDPGDTLDFYLVNNGESKISIISGSPYTYALFSVVRVIRTTDL